jgi:hypothetical protein
MATGRVGQQSHTALELMDNKSSMNVDAEDEEADIGHDRATMVEGAETRRADGINMDLTWPVLVKVYFPVGNTRALFAEKRDFLREYGIDRLRQQFANRIDANGMLKTDTDRLNIFALFASGKEPLPSRAHEANEILPSEFKNDFMICVNRERADAMWESIDPRVVGKASMSKRHVFVTTKNLSWTRFNVLVFGMFGDLLDALQMLRDMKRCAQAYVAAREDWSGKVGMYFHTFGYGVEGILHLNVIDLECVGPTYYALQERNLSIDDVIAVLEDEHIADPILSREEAGLSWQMLITKHFPRNNAKSKFLATRKLLRQYGVARVQNQSSRKAACKLRIHRHS